MTTPDNGATTPVQISPNARFPAGTGCGRGCTDPDDCRGSLVSPCPQGRWRDGETWLSANDGCDGCGGLDGECYCGED